MHQLANKRWLLGPATLLAAINLGVTVLTLLSGVYIARSLDNHQYGQYAFMSNIFLLLTLFFGFGLTGQVAKDVAVHELDASGPLLARLSGLVALRIATALGAVTAGGALFLLDHNVAYLYAGIGAACFLLSDFTVGILSGHKHYKRLALLIAVQALMFAALLFSFGARTVTDIYRFFLLSQLASVLLSAMVALGLPGVRLKPKLSNIPRLNWRTMVAGHIYIIVLLQVAYGAYGVALLGGLKQFGAAGELSIALTITRLLPLLAGTLMSVLYFPQLCVLHQSGARHAFRATATRMLMAASLAAGVGAAVIVATAPLIVPFVYTASHAAAVPLVQILAATTFFWVVDQVITWALIAGDQAWKALIPLVVRMTLMILLWPLALISAPAALPQLIALGYVGSSCICWLAQLWYQRQVLGVQRYAPVTELSAE